MVDTGRLVDGLGVFLTGGASNVDPNASLGGIPSSKRVRGYTPQVFDPVQIPALRIDHVYPACGEGRAYLRVTADGTAVQFSAPGDDEEFGEEVVIAAGETKIVPASTGSKAVRVTRVTGMAFPAGKLMQFDCLYVLNEVLAMRNVDHANRQIGITRYRCIALKGELPHGAIDVKLWCPAVVGAQAVYSLAVEDPVSGAVQTIADAATAPSGVTWSSPTTEGSALVIPGITGGAFKGLWVRKAFPPGVVAAEERVRLSIQYKGA